MLEPLVYVLISFVNLGLALFARSNRPQMISLWLDALISVDLKTLNSTTSASFALWLLPYGEVFGIFS